MRCICVRCCCFEDVPQGVVSSRHINARVICTGSKQWDLKYEERGQKQNETKVNLNKNKYAHNWNTVEVTSPHKGYSRCILGLPCIPRR